MHLSLFPPFRELLQSTEAALGLKRVTEEFSRAVATAVTEARAACLDNSHQKQTPWRGRSLVSSEPLHLPISNAQLAHGLLLLVGCLGKALQGGRLHHCLAERHNWIGDLE